MPNDVQHPPPQSPNMGMPTGVAVGAVKKAVDTLAIVPTRDKISVLTRKVYNVMMHHAQIQGAEHPIYRARLREIIDLVDFNSNNTEVLKDYFRAMVTTKVEWQSPTRAEGTNWGVSGMIAHAELVAVRGGEVMLEWSYSPKLQQAILDPQRYARVSLNFVSQLRTHAALVLYEICSRYVDNPGGLTARNHWTWWRPVLTGAPEGTNETHEHWKYFNRDVVARAVAEVNSITDLQVEAVVHKKGRMMGDLQFKILPRVQQKLPLRSLPSPVDLRDIGRAIELGVPQAKAERLHEKFGAAAFKVGLDSLQTRLARRDLDQVRLPDKFLAAVLANPPTVVSIEMAEGAASENKAKRLALLEQYRDSRRRDAESLFNEMPEAERTDILQRFERTLVTNPALAQTYAKRKLNAPMTRGVFLRFLAETLFGEGWDNPTDSQLLDHAIT